MSFLDDQIKSFKELSIAETTFYVTSGLTVIGTALMKWLGNFSNQELVIGALLICLVVLVAFDIYLRYEAKAKELLILSPIKRTGKYSAKWMVDQDYNHESFHALTVFINVAVKPGKDVTITGVIFEPPHTIGNWDMEIPGVVTGSMKRGQAVLAEDRTHEIKLWFNIKPTERREHSEFYNGRVILIDQFNKHYPLSLSFKYFEPGDF